MLRLFLLFFFFFFSYCFQKLLQFLHDGSLHCSELYSWSLIKFLTFGHFPTLANTLGHFIIMVITQTKKSKLFNSCRQNAQPPTGFQFPRETLNLLWPTKQFLLENEHNMSACSS